MGLVLVGNRHLEAMGLLYIGYYILTANHRANGAWSNIGVARSDELMSHWDWGIRIRDLRTTLGLRVYPGLGIYVQHSG